MLKLILLVVLLAGYACAQQQQQFLRRRQTQPRLAAKPLEEEEPLRPKVYEIRSEVSPNIGDGNFKYYVETSDGLQAQQEGYLNRPGQSQVHEGSYTTFDDAGQVVRINYIADKNGFMASPDSLPTPPPIPVELIKAREDILAQQNQIRQDHLNHFRAAHRAATAAATHRQ
jgi:hypothetical protein